MKKLFKIFIIVAILLCVTTINIYAADVPIVKTEVTDIEISGYKEILEVGETISLSVNVLPINADDCSVSYRSSDTSIATVSQNGEIKGIRAGKVKIFISCGKVEEQIDINVKISARGIHVNDSIIVLKIKQYYQINPTVFPEDATYKDVFYSSSDESVVTVSREGMVTAIGSGSAYITLKTLDAIASIAVVVNERFVVNQNENVDVPIETQMNIPTQMSSKECSLITSDLLELLYNSKQTLKIVGQGYSLSICGEQINNINNELYTSIELQKKDNGLFFELNSGKNLCGNVLLSIEDADKYEYLYLFDETLKKYRLIHYEDVNNLSLSSSGQYLLTNSKIETYSFPTSLIWISVAIVFIASTIYVFLKRKYWFW